MDGSRTVGLRLTPRVYVNDSIDPRVLPTLKNKAIALEQYAASQGILFGYPDYSGFRSLADTTQLIRWRDEAVRAGGATAYYPVAPYGKGYHPKGAAFDVKIVRVPSGKTIAWGYAQLGAYAPRIGLRWGGTFSKPNTDIFHFELAITLDAATQLFNAYQSSLHQTSAGVQSGTPPKANTMTLTETVLNTKPTTTGAALLGVVAILALVGGFFLVAVGVR